MASVSPIQRIPELAQDEPPVIRLLHPPSGLNPRTPAPEAPANGGAKVLNYIRYRLVMIVFLGGLLGSMMAAGAFKVIPSKYTSTAMLRVYMDEQKIYAGEGGGGRSEFSVYVKSQGTLLRSRNVLAAAIRKPEVNNLPVLRSQVDPIAWLEEQIKIDAPEGSEIIRVSFACEDATAGAAIVNAVVEAYETEVIGKELERRNARLINLEKLIGKTQTLVKKDQDNQRTTKVEGKAKDTPDPVMPRNMAEGELSRNRRDLIEIELRMKTLATLLELKERRKLNPDAEIVPVPSDTLDADPKIAKLKAKLTFTKDNRSYTINSLGSSPTSPQVVEQDNTIARQSADLEAAREERRAELQKPQRQAIVKQTEDAIETARIEIESWKGRRDELAKSIQKNIDDIIAQQELKYEPLDVERMSLKDRETFVLQMTQKANLLKVEAEAPNRVSVFQKAAMSMKPESQKQLIGTLVAFLAGFAVVGLGAVLYESQIQRVLTLADAKSSLSGPLVGILPGSSRPGLRPDAALTGESVEKMRTQILRQFGRPGARVIMVTSPIGDEGKAVTAWHLANSYNRTGANTLLLDGDLRTPAMHEILGVANERGLCEVIAGTAPIADVVAKFPSGLSLMSSGQWADGVRAQLTPDRLNVVFRDLASKYDVVIVHLHALLTVAESFLMAQFADGILLTVERLESRLPMASRAQEKIAGLSPECTGLVYVGASRSECLN